jgi:hypothetical protein
MTGDPGPLECARKSYKAAVIWTCLTWFICAVPALGQPISVTAGEHAGFTRIVLNSARAFAWELSERGAAVTIRLAETTGRTVRLDPTRSLYRIPRVRVSDLRVDGPSVWLDLACPCPTRVFEDRPGVLVIDVLDPQAVPQEAVSLPGPTFFAQNTPTSSVSALAVVVGRSLAESLAEEARAGQDEPPASANPSIDPSGAAVTGLSRLLAAAMTQGLVAPTEPVQPQPGLLGPAVADATSLVELPQNLRLRNASDADPRETVAPPPASCPPPDVLAFATSVQNPDFFETLSALNMRLFSEFDAPVPEQLTALIEHYLAWGLGAEARLLAELTPTPIQGHSVLTGLADIIEGRHSNARQALASLTECPDPLALLAIIAGGDATRTAPRPDRMAASYLQLTPGLRMVLGPELLSHLLSTNAIEAARIVLDAFGRVVSPDDPELLRLTATLDRARDNPGLAAQRLDATQTHHIRLLQLRLEIALSQTTLMTPEVVNDAIALASTHRSEEAGRSVMELAIQHQARAGQVRAALDSLEDFRGWLDPTPGAATRMAILRDVIWQEALKLSDPEFLDLILTRGDWRDDTLEPAILSGLADRFAGLGLAAMGEETRARVQGTGQTSRPEPPAEVTEPTGTQALRNDSGGGEIAIVSEGGTWTASARPTAAQREDAVGSALTPLATGVVAPETNLLPNMVDALVALQSALEDEPQLIVIGPVVEPSDPAETEYRNGAIAPETRPVTAAVAATTEPPAVSENSEADRPSDPMSRGISALEGTERLRAALADLNLPLR